MLKSLIYIFTLISIFSCNPENIKPVYQTGEWTFDRCIRPTDAVLYSNYIVLLENNRQSHDISSDDNRFADSKFTVINYLTNQIDTVFQKALKHPNISKLYIKNDSLYAFDFTKKTWLKWQDKWVKKSPFNNKFFLEFQKSLLKIKSRLIYEDDKYFVFSYDRGEFGAAVIFLNKANGTITGQTMITPTSVFKDSSEYIVSGNSWYYMKMSQLIRIKNPDLLPTVPDEQIMYKKDSAKYDFRHQKNLAYYLEYQISDKLPDSIRLKLLSLKKKVIKLYNKQEFYIDEIKLLKRERDSLLKLSNVLEYLIDNAHWYKHDETLCYATFIHKNKLLHLLGDSTLYVAQINNHKIIKQPDTIIARELPTQFLIANEQIKDKKLIVFNGDLLKDKDTCCKVHCLLIDNKIVKRYNIK